MCPVIPGRVTRTGGFGVGKRPDRRDGMAYGGVRLTAYRKALGAALALAHLHARTTGHKERDVYLQGLGCNCNGSRLL
jgi:hypothetical protein